MFGKKEKAAEPAAKKTTAEKGKAPAVKKTAGGQKYVERKLIKSFAKGKKKAK